MCVTDLHDMNLAVKVALNSNTNKQNLRAVVSNVIVCKCCVPQVKEIHIFDTYGVKDKVIYQNMFEGEKLI